MEPRINYFNVAPDVLKTMLGVENHVRNSGLENSLLELVKTRVSQINNCAFCLDMHTKDAMAAGETSQRLFALSAWRETPFFTDRERAGLAWAEAVTLLNENYVPDEVYEKVKSQFSEKEIVELTLAIVAINGWNRLNVSMRMVPGTYEAK